MTKNEIRFITYIGMFSAISFVLYAFELSVGFLFPATSFLKIDFSDIPACVGTLQFGPLFGVLVELIKNIFHICITKEPAFSGELGNFLSGIFIILPLYFVLHKKNTVANKIFAVVTSAISVTLVMIFFNTFVTLPLYGIHDFSVKTSMLIAGFIPFNLIKGLIVPTVSILIFELLKKNKIT